jgi:hypothetical protein
MGISSFGIRRRVDWMGSGRAMGESSMVCSGHITVGSELIEE